MHSFHVPDLNAGTVVLPEEEAHHAVNVLRLKPGTTVLLLNGRGAAAVATMEQVDKKACTALCSAITEHAPERLGRIHIACAPTKNIDRFEWMLEKCTEIGVDRITPLITERTERTHLRHDRSLKVLVSAMKQSQRAWLPMLDGPTTIDQLLKAPLPAQRFFGWCEAEREPLVNAFRSKADVIMLIGPEGDFTPQEADTLRIAGFVATGLGNARFRTETAAIVACATFNMRQAM
ncbi:MAG: 16S rRNA (uracil(1498)-N(3))-methyltransferase [Flavobacteriales bacterium]|nr:MAG: 16S rRNA (uracil(1498)-N(3))-methyltransferase [Flavobacteriales bacterium]